MASGAVMISELVIGSACTMPLPVAPVLPEVLQAATSGQGQGFFWLRDDQANRSRAQSLLDAPQQVGLARGAKHMQPLAYVPRQPAQHRQLGHMGGQNPDQGAGMSYRL